MKQGTRPGPRRPRCREPRWTGTSIGLIRKAEEAANLQKENPKKEEVMVEELY